MKKLPVVLLLLASVLFFSISFSQTHESDQTSAKKGDHQGAVRRAGRSAFQHSCKIRKYRVSFRAYWNGSENE